MTFQELVATAAEIAELHAKAMECRVNTDADGNFGSLTWHGMGRVNDEEQRFEALGGDPIDLLRASWDITH